MFLQESPTRRNLIEINVEATNQIAKVDDEESEEDGDDDADEEEDDEEEDDEESGDSSFDEAFDRKFKQYLQTAEGIAAVLVSSIYNCY